MPVMDGAEANNAIREYEVEAGLPSAYRVIAANRRLAKRARRLEQKLTTSLPIHFNPFTFFNGMPFQTFFSVMLGA